MHDPAIDNFKNIAEVYPNPQLNEIPYFDGDNWPDILEDILKLDKKADADAEKKLELRRTIEGIRDECWAGAAGRRAEHQKPSVLAGYYQGQAPPKKKQKQDPQTVLAKKPAKPKLTPQDRLQMVLSTTKRDFLVVRLLDDGKGARPDPDADVPVASVGGDHSISSFFRSERLEFSSLRHAKFSSMVLINALLCPGAPPERFSDADNPPHERG